MRSLSFTVFTFLLFPFIAKAQNNDCITAELICSNVSIAFNPSGPGANDFLPAGSNSGCLVTGEHQSAWYYFQFQSDMPPNGRIEFTITPDAGAGQDYDFAVFGPNVSCAALGSPIRCSYAANGCEFCPQTGLGMGTTDFSESPTGDGFVAALEVQPGQGFYLLIDNFSNNSTGFSLTWGGTAAPFLDCMAPECQIAVTATPNYSLCEGGFTQLMANVTNASGAVSYQWISSNGAEAYLTNRFIRQPFLIVPVGAPDTLNYALVVADGPCTDTAYVMVNVLKLPTPVISGVAEFCEGDSTVLSLDTTYASYQWSTGSTDSAIVVSSSGNVTVSVTNESGCAASASYLVLENLAALTIIEASFCENESLLFADSLITAEGTYEWQYTTTAGCDSIVQLIATKLATALTEIDTTLTFGQPFDGVLYSQDTTLEFALQTVQGCDSLVRVHLQIVTSTNEPGGSLLAVHLFPNPTTGAVTLRFDQMPREPMRIYLFNELGQTVLMRKLSAEPEQRLSLDGLPAATYRAVIMAAGKVLAVEKLVIL